MIKFIVPRTNLLSWMSLGISTAKQLEHLYASISQVCRPAQEKPRQMETQIADRDEKYKIPDDKFLVMK